MRRGRNGSDVYEWQKSSVFQRLEGKSRVEKG